MKPNAPAAEKPMPPPCVSWTGGFAETTFIQKPDAVPLFKSITDNILLKKIQIITTPIPLHVTNLQKAGEESAPPAQRGPWEYDCA